MTPNKSMRVGTALIKQLSETFYPKINSIFREMIVNSRDAGATKVEINLSKDNVEVIDNGKGMDEAGLMKYFYISHSTKKENPFIKVKGVNRQIVGKFGIGKLSMHQLGNQIFIETWKDGMKYYASFNFKEVLKKEFIDEINLDVRGPIPIED